MTFAGCLFPEVTSGSWGCPQRLSAHPCSVCRLLAHVRCNEQRMKQPQARQPTNRDAAASLLCCLTTCCICTICHGSLQRCRIVGRPWGQFQGARRSARWLRIFAMIGLSRAVPTMTLDLHARMASIARTLQHGLCLSWTSVGMVPTNLWEAEGPRCSVEELHTSKGGRLSTTRCLTPSGSLAVELRRRHSVVTQARERPPHQTWCCD